MEGRPSLNSEQGCRGLGVAGQPRPSPVALRPGDSLLPRLLRQSGPVATWKSCALGSGFLEPRPCLGSAICLAQAWQKRGPMVPRGLLSRGSGAEGPPSLCAPAAGPCSALRLCSPVSLRVRLSPLPGTRGSALFPWMCQCPRAGEGATASGVAGASPCGAGGLLAPRSARFVDG